MLERADRLVFFFTIECTNCHNIAKYSHVSIEEQTGVFVCTLCGKNIKIPDVEILIRSSKDLGAYLGDPLNSKFIRLVLNEGFKGESSVPGVGH